MDIKELIESKVNEVVEKIKSDKGYATKFKKEPVKAIEELLGVDLPDEQVEQIITLVKAKLKTGNATDLLGTLTSLFGKKD